MKLTVSQVRGIADLANLHLSEEEIARMARDLDEILTHVDKLNELETGDVEPMAQVLFEAGATASLREDVEVTPLDNTAALGNAPLAGAGFFKVPKVIER
ncbi:MAG: Asp-tRNA(Asn)/Glu-tRNA(Gln) amidotransferase subunit GatC [Bryobacteraceae bacterium]